MQSQLDHLLAGYENKAFDVKDVWVKAIRAKLSGNYAEAIADYQLWGSQVGFSPLPHYFIAQMYSEQKNYAAAENELKKAQLKEGFLKDGKTIPEIDVAFGDLYKLQDKTKDALAAYAKASSKATDRADLHRSLSQRYKEMKNTALQKAEDAIVAELQSKQQTPVPTPAAPLPKPAAGPDLQ